MSPMRSAALSGSRSGWVWRGQVLLGRASGKLHHVCVSSSWADDLCLVGSVRAVPGHRLTFSWDPSPDTCVSRGEVIGLPGGLWLELGIGSSGSLDARKKVPCVAGDQLPKWAASALIFLPLSAAVVKADFSLRP